MSERVSRREFLSRIGGAALYSNLPFASEIQQSSEYASGTVPVNTLSQRGTLYGIGGLGFTDDSKQTTTPEQFINIAISRHLQIEEFFGHPLNAHLHIATFYQKNREEHTRNENAGRIIQQAFPSFERAGRTLSVSLELTPPAWYTIDETAQEMEMIMTGGYDNLPKELLEQYIDKINLSYDFERLVWRNRLHDPNDAFNFVSIREFNEKIYQPYINYHQRLQHARRYTPTSRIYVFGTNSADDFFIDDAHFPPTIILDVDSLGSAEQKAISAENFSQHYRRKANMIFALVSSPHLDPSESDSGFGRWDYGAVVEWVHNHSRGDTIILE